MEERTTRETHCMKKGAVLSKRKRPDRYSNSGGGPRHFPLAYRKKKTTNKAQPKKGRAAAPLEEARSIVCTRTRRISKGSQKAKVPRRKKEKTKKIVGRNKRGKGDATSPLLHTQATKRLLGSDRPSRNSATPVSRLRGTRRHQSRAPTANAGG